MINFEVARDDFRRTRILQQPTAPLPDGAARLRPQLLAMTANNVTYAAMGEGDLGYYDFFPAAAGWGRPPAWGFAVVEASKAQGCAVGDRYYGYYPLADSVDLWPSSATAQGFVDGADHRRAKAPVYNLYLRTATDPAYVEGREAEQALFRPLYATGWWAADFVWGSAPAPRTVIVSSASAKTAIAMAHQLRRLGSPALVALTSSRNLHYVRSTGLYRQVLTYDEVAEIGANGPAIFVDYLGRDDLTRSVHAALGAALTRSVMIGATEWSAKPGGIQLPKGDLAGPRPEFFFVPAHAAARIAEAGADLGRAMRADMSAFYEASGALVTPRRSTGHAAIEACWRRLCQGDVNPREGLVVIP